MKAAPVLRALGNLGGAKQTLVHTGQHYDANMSDVFFSQLEMPTPDVNLGVGSGSHARQTAEIMTRFEPVLLERRPDFVLVYGDVNSTIAAALVSAKLGIRVGHVEAGLRAFDWTMPEEINRVVTDRLADLLFTRSEDADVNLGRERVSPEKIHRVGNVMIDSLVRLLPVAANVPNNGFPEQYALVTLHRPANVDDGESLRNLLHFLVEIRRAWMWFFLCIRGRDNELPSLDMLREKMHLSETLPYIEFLALQTRAALVITDSGGIQEETTYLGVPCLTLRNNTERSVTVSVGTNVIVGQDREKLRAELSKVVNGNAKKGAIPPLWDGHAGERIATILGSIEL
jgi:UDP-N-acetylglucosamine 2-epimerase (non-hydrolysing)